MSGLTAERTFLVGSGTIKRTKLPLKAGSVAWKGGLVAIDTASPGAVVPGASGVSTLKPIGWFSENVDNSAGGFAAVGVELFRDHVIAYYDSVTGAGAVTAANLLQQLYLASDHEVTTIAGSNAPAGIMWAFNVQGYPNAVGVEAPW